MSQWLCCRRSPIAAESPIPKSARDPVTQCRRSLRKNIPMSEVAQHTSSSDIWIVVNGYVIDITRFINIHPGGSDSMLPYFGKDCSSTWNLTHEQNMIKDCVVYDIVGTVEGAKEGILQLIGLSEVNKEEENDGDAKLATLNASRDDNNLASTSLLNSALSSEHWSPFKLVEKVSLTHDVCKFKFALPSPHHSIGIGVGQHISLQYTDASSGTQVVRSYTPTSSNHTLGYVEFCVKIYFPSPPRFPNGGKMSQYLDRLCIGDVIEMKGPKVGVTARAASVLRIYGS